MKKNIYVLLFLVSILLTGCNLFKGLDKEDLSSPEAFNFKIDDAIAKGEYSVAVGLIEDKIQGNAALKAVNTGVGAKFTLIDSRNSTTAAISDLQAISDFLNSNITDSSTREATEEYIALKLTQAEAYSGEAKLKLTDIIAELTKSTSPNVGKVAMLYRSSSNARLSLGDVIPANLIREKLEAATKAYGSAVPVSTGAAFDFLTREYKQQPFLNAALINIVCFVNDFIYIFSTNGTIDGLVTSGDSTFTARKDEWNGLAWPKMHLLAAQAFLNAYVAANPNGLIKQTDIQALNNNMNNILTYVQITTGNYDTFISTAGIR